MSNQFSNTTLKNGLIQLCEDWCGFSDGDISGNPLLLSKITSYINLGLDDAWAVIIRSAGLWELDDVNFTDYPMMTTNLVSGQRDYSFVTDGSGNIILDIYRVMVADPSGTFHEIYPVNEQTPTSHTGNVENTDSFINGLNATGTPTRYGKTGNGVFLDVIPNYNSVNGLKVFMNREASYFTVNDTSKRPGFTGIFQSYPAVFASEMYAGIKTLSNLKKLMNDKITMRRDIQEYYSKRDKDVRKGLSANVDNMK